MIITYPNQSETEPDNCINEDVIEYIQNLDALLQQCALQAYNLHALDRTNAKLRNWYTTAHRYLNSEEVFSPHAKYGYAVEEIFNLSSHSIACPPRFRCFLQAVRGHTRPDIVITQNGKDTAWLDITSNSSCGHILGKAGYGWHTIPYVAELLYPDLDFSQLRTTQFDSIAGRAWVQSRIRIAEVKKRTLHNYMLRCTNKAIDRLSQRVELNKHIVAQTFNNCFNNVFGNTYHPAIHSILIEYKDGGGSYIDAADWLLSEFYKNEPRNLSLAHQYIIQSYQCDQSINDYLDEDEIELLLA